MAVDWGLVLASYAAGVSTIVGAQGILRELPWVRIRTVRDATIRQHGKPPQPVLIVSVANGGRRPVTIEMVSFIAKGNYLSTPSIWVSELPVTLHDGEAHSLYHPENGTIPQDAVFLARDKLGRWWPRRRELRLRFRRRRYRTGSSGRA